ncbi:hypothetical protein WT11_13840 [Burkholderia stagnalis]|nr:hypothetical protein WT11_13840 [Burkholderia stagnalis]
MIRDLLGFCEELLELLAIRVHCLAPRQNVPEIRYFREFPRLQIYDREMDLDWGQSLRMASIKTILTDFARQ